MGRYAFSNKSKLVIGKDHFKDAYLELDFVDDDDKSDQENLIDCLTDFQFTCVEESASQLIFIVSDDNSDADFNWQVFYKLRNHLQNGSFYEEIHHDQNRILVGTIIEGQQSKQLSRDFYELITKDGKLSRGQFLENFDVDLSLD